MSFFFGRRKRLGNTSTGAQRRAALSQTQICIEAYRDPARGDSSSARECERVRTSDESTKSRLLLSATFIAIARDFLLRWWGWSVPLR